MPSEFDLSGWHVRKEAEVGIGQVHVALEHWGIMNLTRNRFDHGHTHKLSASTNMAFLNRRDQKHHVKRMGMISTCNNLFYSNEVENFAEFLS